MLNGLKGSEILRATMMEWVKQYPQAHLAGSVQRYLELLDYALKQTVELKEKGLILHADKREEFFGEGEEAIIVGLVKSVSQMFTDLNQEQKLWDAMNVEEIKDLRSDIQLMFKTLQADHLLPLRGRLIDFLDKTMALVELVKAPRCCCDGKCGAACSCKS